MTSRVLVFACLVLAFVCVANAQFSLPSFNAPDVPDRPNIPEPDVPDRNSVSAPTIPSIPSWHSWRADLDDFVDEAIPEDVLPPATSPRPIADEASAAAIGSQCACLIAANPTAHCDADFAEEVVVIRATVQRDTQLTFTVNVDEVLFNNSPRQLTFGQSLIVATPNCGPRLTRNSSYFFRLVGEGRRFTLKPCDYFALDNTIEADKLSCGASLTDCQRYPCPPATPQCTPINIQCIRAPCPQHTCTSCAAVLCAQIADCDIGFHIETPTGQCCPQCVADKPLDCTNVPCTDIACAPGFTEIRDGCCITGCEPGPSDPPCGLVLCAECQEGFHPDPTEDECCRCVADEPLNCDNVPCPAIACAPGFTEIRDGCCITGCEPDPTDCTLVLCAQCQEGFHLEPTEDNCCECAPDVNCALVRCAAPPTCLAGFHLETPAGQCCQRCVPDGVDCTLVRCAAPPTCDSGFHLAKPDGKCCEECVADQDCSTTFCTLQLIICDEGFYSGIAPGECCQSCLPNPDCSAIACPAIFINCDEGFYRGIAPGECCPSCIPNPDCSGIFCPACVGETPPGACCPVCGTEPLPVTATDGTTADTVDTITGDTADTADTITGDTVSTATNNN